MSKHLLRPESQHLTQRLLDILFPPHCAGCRRSGTIFCPACVATCIPPPPPLCQRCGASLANSTSCQYCRYHPLGLSGLRSTGVYQGPLQAAIRALKYNGNTRLAQPLGHMLASGYLAYGLQADCVIPVPLHSERYKQRGYNHAQLLAEVLAAQINRPLYTNIVIRQRDTPAQVGLNANERRQNVAGAFLLTPSLNIAQSLAGRHILLIDDVFTSGSTLAACAEPLFAARAASVWGLVVARPL